MRYAYCRVSTEQQHLDRQIEGIKKAYPDIKEEDIFVEKISGRKKVEERSEYAVLRRILRSGDELVLDSLDRLSRTKAGIKAELEYLKTKGIIVRVLVIPTTLISLEGQEWAVELINNLLIELYSTLSEQELREKDRRQRAGIEAAKERGVYKGRKPIATDDKKLKDLYPRWKTGAIKTSEFRQLLGVNGTALKPNTFYRRIQQYEMQGGACQCEQKR